MAVGTGRDARLNRLHSPASASRPPRQAAGRTGSRERKVTIVAGLVAALLVGIFGRELPFLSRLEYFVDDLRVAFLAPKVPVHPSIAVVTITDRVLDETRRRSPIDRTFLARLLAQLDDAKPAAIGIDILFDHATTPDEDGMLRAQLRRMHVPVVVAYGTSKSDPDQITERETKFLTDFLASIGNPLVKQAHVRLPTDRDGVVRMLPDAGQPDATIPSLGVGVATASGLPWTSEGGRMAYYGELGPWADRFMKVEASLLQPSAPSAALMKGMVSGRAVLVGSYLEDTDLHQTPFTALTGLPTPGVVLQASSLAQLLDGRWIRVPSRAELFLIVATMVGAGFAIGLQSSSNAGTMLLLGGVIALYWAFCIATYAVPIAEGHGRSLYPMMSPAVAGIIATVFGYALTRQRFRFERNFIHGALAKYVSASVAKELMANPALLRVGGERRLVTALFTDIEGFTSLSESLEPAALVEILNRYLHGMTRIVFDHDGTLDKYIGDAIVAIWNAPIERPDHAAQAVACAVALSRFAEEFAEEQRQAGIPFGRTRIGVQTGPAIVGNFGGEEKLNYTAIGDTINLTSRLEGANKHIGTGILVGETAAMASARQDLRPVAELVVKGREGAVPVWEPVPHWTGARMQQYISAYHLLRTGDPGAVAALRELATEPDPVIRLHLDRLAAGQRGARIVLEDK